MAGARPGQRGVAGEPGEDLGVDRVGRHDLLPLGPLGVADHDRDRGAEGEAVPHPAEEGDLVLLELHPGAAAVAEPPPREVVRHHLGGDRHTGGQTLQRRDECGAVRLPRGQPAQPAQRCSSCIIAQACDGADRCGSVPVTRSSHVRRPRPGRGPLGGQRRGQIPAAQVRRRAASSPAGAWRPAGAGSPAGHQLHLEHRLVHQQVEPADDGAAAAGPGGGQGGRPRVVEHVEEGRRAAPARRRRARRRRRPGWWRSPAARRAPRRRPSQSAVRTLTPSRSPHCRISAARASLRTYAVTSPVADPGERGQRGGGGRAGAEDGGGARPCSTPRSRSAATMPGMSVLSPRRRPSSVRTTVLTASTEAAVSLISSSSGMTARFSGMVSDSPAQLRRPRLAEEAGQRGLVDLEAVVRPAGQAQFRVGGAVQHRGERVGDRRAEDGRPCVRRSSAVVLALVPLNSLTLLVVLGLGLGELGVLPGSIATK